MAWQKTGSIAKATSVETAFLGLIKFKLANAAAGTVTVLDGNELVNTISLTTNTNACVATVTLYDNMYDVADISSDYRDDGQNGYWTSTGNVTGENTNAGTPCTFKIAFFNAGGSTVTTNNVNANAAVVGVTMWFRNTNVDKGD